MRAKEYVGILLALGVGIATGRFLSRGSGQQSEEFRRQAEQLDAIQNQLSALRQTASSGENRRERPGQAVTAADIEQIVRRVLDDRKTAPPAPSPPPPPEPTADNIDANVRAERVFSDALNAKRWTERDSAEMRQLIRKVSADQRLALVKRFAVAINSGQVQVDTEGPPIW